MLSRLNLSLLLYKESWNCWIIRRLAISQLWLCTWKCIALSFWTCIYCSANLFIELLFCNNWLLLLFYYMVPYNSCLHFLLLFTLASKKDMCGCATLITFFLFKKIYSIINLFTLSITTRWQFYWDIYYNNFWQERGNELIFRYLILQPPCSSREKLNLLRLPLIH